MEPVLQHHRFADLTIYLLREEKIEFNKEETQRLLQQYVDLGKATDAKRVQSVEFALAMRGELALEDFDNVKIPREKRFINLINNRAVMKYYLDSANRNALESLKNELTELYQIDSSNQRITTNLAIIGYNLASFTSFKQMRKYYAAIGRKRNVDLKIRSRIMLNVGAAHDWNLYMLKGKKKMIRLLRKL